MSPWPSLQPSRSQFRSEESPDDELVNNCAQRWLWEELRLLDPDFLGLIGSNALRFVMGLKGITRWRGQWLPLPDWHREVLCLATFHPSFVLRMENMDSPAPSLFRDDLSQLAIKAGVSLP